LKNFSGTHDKVRPRKFFNSDEKEELQRFRPGAYRGRKVCVVSPHENQRRYLPKYRLPKYRANRATSTVEIALGEKNGRRAAFVAGALAGDAALGLGTLRGDEHREIHLYKLRGYDESSECACRSRYIGLGEVRAPHTEGRRTRRLAHLHGAMVIPIAAAADGQMRIDVLSPCKQRCNGRKTEDCEHQQCEDTAHIVTSLAGSLKIKGAKTKTGHNYRTGSNRAS
jgi:hypothetical protein